MCLSFVAQICGVFVNSVHFVRNLYSLWAVAETFSATNAVSSLPVARDFAVHSDKELAASLRISRMAFVVRNGIVVYTAVVEAEDGGDVQTEGARHAISTTGAGNDLVLRHVRADAHQEIVFVFSDGV